MMKLLGLFLAYVFMRGECTSLSFNYKTDPVCNGRRSTEYIWKTLQQVSKTKCVIACDREVMCVLVTYNTDTRVCYLHTHTIYDLLPTMMADNNFVCLLPADSLESWVETIIAASPFCCGYTYDFMIGAVDGWLWIPELAPTAFVELQFAIEMYVERIYIYEAYASVGHSDISVRDPAGDWMAVWSGPQVPKIDGSRVFSPELLITAFKSSAVRLDIVLEGVDEYIDSIKLVGKSNFRSRA